MRWFLGLVLVIALLAGVLYGVGRFLLPNALEVTRTVTIERPRAAVFAMSNDLRIAREWSPYYAMDPDADYSFSGDGAGAGQTMRWVSNLREVGSGRISIVSSRENEEIESILELGDRATLNSRFELRNVDGGTFVSWMVTAQCAEGWINVPCRYMNLILGGRIQGNLDAGLARLKTLAEQLPNVDFEGYDIVPVPVQPQDVIFVDVSIATDAPTFADRATAESEGLDALNNYMASTGGSITRGGALVRVFPADNGVGGRYRFSVGYPYTGPAPLRLVGVRVGQTPGGAALRVEFQGRRSQIGAMYQRLDAYMQAHRIAVRPGGEAWEIVDLASIADSGHPGDPIERAEIYFPIE
jgi:hypothetical protein